MAGSNTSQDLQAPASGEAYKESGLIANLADKAEEVHGGKGLVVVTDTTVHTPVAGLCFARLQILTTTVLAAITADPTAPITGTLTGISLPAGTWLYGKFLSVQLTSGSLFAYNAQL